MEALLKALIDKGYAYDVAAKMLGIDTQKGNPKYTFGMPFTGGKFEINPMKIIANQGIKSILKGGGSGIMKAMPLFAGALGLGYLTNPLREGSYNYNPHLRGELDYAGEKGFLARNPNSGLLIYGPDSVLSGKNAVHGGKSVGYSRDLTKFIKKMQAIKDRGYNRFSKIPFTETQQKRLDQAKTEIGDLNLHEWMEIDAEIEKEENRKTYSAPYQGKVHGNGGDNNYGSATQSGGFDPGGFEQDGTGRQGYGRGGIASL